MSGWGLSNFIRVTIGTDRENKQFIRALRHIFFSKKEISR
jgi:histidinol-phosphate/aromatic aminotransferase/cobyric acid decarboxylase-like protein